MKVFIGMYDFKILSLLSFTLEFVEWMENAKKHAVDIRNDVDIKLNFTQDSLDKIKSMHM